MRRAVRNSQPRVKVGCQSWGCGVWLHRSPDLPRSCARPGGRPAIREHHPARRSKVIGQVAVGPSELVRGTSVLRSHPPRPSDARLKIDGDGWPSPILIRATDAEVLGASGCTRQGFSPGSRPGCACVAALHPRAQTVALSERALLREGDDRRRAHPCGLGDAAAVDCVLTAAYHPTQTTRGAQN